MSDSLTLESESSDGWGRGVGDSASICGGLSIVGDVIVCDVAEGVGDGGGGVGEDGGGVDVSVSCVICVMGVVRVGVSCVGVGCVVCVGVSCIAKTFHTCDRRLRDVQ